MTITASTQSNRRRRPARRRSLRLGDTTVTYLPDGAVQLLPRGWLPDTTDEDWAAHPEYLDDSGYLVGSLGGLLVEHDGRAMLIDAGYGPQSNGAGNDPFGAVESGALLDNLAAVGREPATVEAVAFTHLHPDHLGWAWHPAPGSDRSAFTRAEYLVAASEWEHRELAGPEGTTPEILALLAPNVRTVTHGEQVFPGVRVQVTGGHTLGHASFVVTVGEQRLVMFGDAFHSAIQISYPEWSAVNDHDRRVAVAQRRRLVAELAEPETIGVGVHFADVTFGRVDASGQRPVWLPVPTEPR